MQLEQFEGKCAMLLKGFWGGISQLRNLPELAFKLLTEASKAVNGLPKHHNRHWNEERPRGNFLDYLKLLQDLPSLIQFRCLQRQ